ncbi:MAG: enoyl-CoA hydratase-related protein [Gammaproteobacteria bacterium]
MTDESILLSSPSAGVTVITLNRPEKRNAMNAQLIQQLTQILKTLATDSETRVVMITGHGEHFCAGADISWMQKIAQSPPHENLADATELALLLYTLYIFPKPTLALVHGMTLGGGLGLVACCDIAISAENANFCFSETKIGLTPSVISPYIISAIGERAARYYFLTARKFAALEAKRLGFIHEVVAVEKLLESGIALAQELLNNSPHALSEAKKLITHVAPIKITAELVEYTANHLATMRAKPEAQEGLRAFLEKRVPEWK